jgi:hypothetical protein
MTVSSLSDTVVARPNLRRESANARHAEIMANAADERNIRAAGRIYRPRVPASGTVVRQTSDSAMLLGWH